MDILKKNIPQLAELLKTKKLSAKELTTSYLDRIKKNDSVLNSYITLSEDVLKDAEKIDKQGFNSDSPLLRGIPISLKDVINTKGLKTTAASKILSNYIPPYDATVAKKVKENGALILGKNNMDEFAMGSSNENSSFGNVKNPWDLNKVPGGSSGGSAAAVAAGLCQVSYGTDTGGSIRLPASFTGTLAIKPTYGRVSRYGVIAFASSLDQIGPIARNTEDLSIAYDAVTGRDEKDSTSSEIKAENIYNYLVENVIGKENQFKNLIIGIPRHLMEQGVEPEILASLDEVIKELSSMGLKFKDIELPHSKYALDVYYIIATSEASSNLSRYDGVRFGTRSNDYSDLNDLYELSRGQGFGDEVKRRIMLGTFALSAGYFDAYFSKAAKVRALIREDFKKAFKECDSILMPVAPTTAFNIGEKTDDPLQMYLADIFTISINLAAVPSLAFPSGFSATGMPIGMQFIGDHFNEKVLFALSWLMQKSKPDCFNNIAELN